MALELRKSIVLAGLALGAVFVAAQALGDSKTALLGGCSRQHGQHQVAASREQLDALLGCHLEGITIALQPGEYGRINMDDVKGLTLTSVDPSKPASFEAIIINRGNRITLNQLNFAGSTTGLPWRLQVLSSNDIDASRIDLSGGGDYSQSTPGGIYVRWGHRVSLTRIKVSTVMNGIRLLDSSHVTVSDNLIRDFRSDAIQGSASSQLVISGNYISRAHPAPGDHPDGVQIFALANQASASDILIRDNLIERGSGGLTQGIYVTSDKNPFINLQIINNLVIGSMYHGIAVAGATGGEVRDNIVVPIGGQKNWILLTNAPSLVLEGNVAQDLIKDKVLLAPGSGLGKNRRFITSEKEATARSNAWKDRHFPGELRNGS